MISLSSSGVARYVTAANGGRSPLAANQTSIGQLETATSGSPLVAGGTAISSAQQFHGIY